MSGVLLALSSPHPPTSLQSLQGLWASAWDSCLNTTCHPPRLPSWLVARPCAGAALLHRGLPLQQGPAANSSCSSQFLRTRASQGGTRDTTRQRHPGSSSSDQGAPPLQPDPSDPQCGGGVDPWAWLAQAGLPPHQGALFPTATSRKDGPVSPTGSPTCRDAPPGHSPMLSTPHENPVSQPLHTAGVATIPILQKRILRHREVQ